jgi:hypothetical protein
MNYVAVARYRTVQNGNFNARATLVLRLARPETAVLVCHSLLSPMSP